MNPKVADATAGATERQQCPECGSSTISTRLQKQRLPYGDGNRAVELEVLLPVRKCSECGFEYLDDAAETIRHEAVCRHLGVLTPGEIRSIRQEYDLSRADFSRLTRLGEATLTRWENGILIQNPAYDRYLRLLRFPENIQRLEIKDNPTSRGSSTVVSLVRFRALKDEDEARRRQADFQLRKHGAST